MARIAAHFAQGTTTVPQAGQGSPSDLEALTNYATVTLSETADYKRININLKMIRNQSI